MRQCVVHGLLHELVLLPVNDDRSVDEVLGPRRAALETLVFALLTLQNQEILSPFHPALFSQ